MNPFSLSEGLRQLEPKLRVSEGLRYCASSRGLNEGARLGVGR